MCTVSFIKHSKGFSLTSNRDEQASRPTLAPDVYIENGVSIIYPKDEVAGGTWIATADYQVSVCLLNGGFVKHQRNLPYRKSRGQILKERFSYDSNESFCNGIDLKQVEPFTLLLIDHASSIDFIELVWDGSKKYIREIDTNYHHIWASSTLYNKEQINLRYQWFKAFTNAKTSISFSEIVNFHTGSYTKEKAYDLVMQRNSNLKTVSVSQINITPDERTFNYFDLIRNSNKNINLDILCKTV